MLKSGRSEKSWRAVVFAHSDVGDGAARCGVGRSRRRVTGINAKQSAGTGVSGMSRE